MKKNIVVKNAYVFQTYRQCFEKRDFTVVGDRIYSVSPAIEEQLEEDCTVIDATGKYIIPGLIDIHMHIESSMTYPKEFSNAVLKYGVTSVVADPHEIANVFGMEGIRSFMDQDTKLDIFYGIPSCVPSTDAQTETSGASIGPDEVKELLQDPRVVCLGEVMNFKDMVSTEQTKIREIIACCQKNERKVRIEGHCPKLSHENYNQYIYYGVDSDHTQQTAASLLEKIDLGMFMELQKKSLVPEVIEAIKENQLYESIALITDDTMPDTLLKGQLNEIVKYAVELGMPVEKAIYCATYTPARRMYLDDRGVIAPGKKADFIILDNLQEFSIVDVYKNGEKIVPDQEHCGKEKADTVFPSHFYQSVHCRQAEATDFTVAYEQDGEVLANVICIHEFGTFTEKQQVKLEVRNKKVCWQEAGLSLVTIFGRHNKTQTVTHGFVKNAFTQRGAVATTWSHDSHNLLVIGNSVEDMIVAQRDVCKMQGGYTVAANGVVMAHAPLTIGGIISDEPIEVLADQMGRVREAITQLGYRNNNVIMSISTLALVVSPELKMTDKGLYNVRTQQFEELIMPLNL